MGESRTELLNWLNELLSTRYTKVEQAGSGKNYQKEKNNTWIQFYNVCVGAAYCQIFDSIFGSCFTFFIIFF